MAEDNMMQSLFCHKNIFKLIEESKEYEDRFKNKKLSALDRQERQEYIKEKK